MLPEFRLTYAPSYHRLDDVEAKMVETEKEAEKARKDSKNARDQFNEIKRKRFVLHYP